MLAQSEAWGRSVWPKRRAKQTFLGRGGSRNVRDKIRTYLTRGKPSINGSFHYLLKKTPDLETYVDKTKKLSYASNFERILILPRTLLYLSLLTAPPGMFEIGFSPQDF